MGRALLLQSMSYLLPEVVTQNTGLGGVVGATLNGLYLLGNRLREFPLMGYPSSSLLAYFCVRDFPIWGALERLIF